MSRERWLILYGAVVGALGWAATLLSGPGQASPANLVLFLMLALLVESARFRVSPTDAHSLVGIVLLTAGFTLGPADGALVAAVSGLLFGVVHPFVRGGPRTVYTLFARPFLRGGTRALGILSGYWMAVAATGSPPDTPTLYILSAVCYALVVLLSRAVREYIQGGKLGVLTWWRGAWFTILSAEIATLPVSWLAAAIYQQLGMGYFLLGSVILVSTSLTVRRGSLNIQRQRRSVSELAKLNQVSRAIIRSGLDVEALADLIYGEASKLVDTTSFHLGLFEPHGDQYTLLVRVQDRVRLPPLTVPVPAGDGIIGWMRETGRALLVHDFQEEMERLPARPRYQSDRPPRSGIYVPLIADDEVIGSISIQSYRPNAFDADDMRLLSLIADQAAVAIARARAFNEAEQRAVQLLAIHEVGERITAILDLDQLLASVVLLIRGRFAYHPVHIFLLDDRGKLTLGASTVEGDALERVRNDQMRVGVGLVGSAVTAGQPLLVNDVRADPRYISDDPGTRSELVVPLRFGDRVIGVLDVQAGEPDGFDEGDLFVMRTLAGQIAVAIESARAFTAQREEAWTLNALLQVAENAARASSLDELLPAIVRLPPLLLGCDRCYCLLAEGGDPRGYALLAAYGLSPALRAGPVGRRIADDEAPLLAQAARGDAPVVPVAPSRRAELGPALAAPGDGMVLLMPLRARGLSVGMLIADYDDPEPALPPRALTLYAGIASQVAGALETALLAEDAARAERLEQELRVAREIQTALLPTTPPSVAGYDIAATWRAARLVGGDFFDFWRLHPTADHRRPATPAEHTVSSTARSSVADGQPSSLGFVIADVSDKGVPAAMFMALSRSLMRAAALDGSTPSVAVARANRWITRDSESAMFVTLFYGILEPETGRLRYTCAGHNPPLLIAASGGAARELTTHDVALGVLEEAVFHEEEVRLAPGDLLVCYTDGITEAVNGADESFGVERLLDVATSHRGDGAGEVLEAIGAALLAFVGERPPFDDVTLLVLKRT